MLREAKIGKIVADFVRFSRFQHHREVAGENWRIPSIPRSRIADFIFSAFVNTVALPFRTASFWDMKSHFFLQAWEWVSARRRGARAKRAVGSKRTSEWCERIILVCSKPPCVVVIVVIIVVLDKNAGREAGAIFYLLQDLLKKTIKFFFLLMSPKGRSHEKNATDGFRMVTVGGFTFSRFSQAAWILPLLIYREEVDSYYFRGARRALMVV